MVERFAYDVLDEVAGVAGGDVFSTGGGSRSDVWMQCRADATGRILHRPACGESAFGAAVLAASGSLFAGLTEAIGAMVRLERTYTPNPAATEPYDQHYRRFRSELEKRGYA